MKRAISCRWNNAPRLSRPFADAAILFLLVVWPAAPARGQWQRTVMSGKGEFVDHPGAHPLAYFMADPFLRDDGQDLAGSARDYTFATDVRPVGSLAGFKIVDVFYRITPRGQEPKVSINWKSILVEAQPGAYREIFHLQVLQTEPTASRIVDAGNEAVLATMTSDGGNGGGCFEGYWWFDASGPHALDFSEVTRAIAEALPPGARFRTTCDELHLEREEVVTWAQRRDAECHACGGLGKVTARFRLNGAHAQPADIKYSPDAASQ